MKLIGPLCGRAVALMTPEEWYSRSLSPADAFKLIQERYQFANSPNLSLPWDETKKNGLKFVLGKISIKDATVPIQDLTFYNHGIVVNATTTDDAEYFLKVSI